MSSKWFHLENLRVIYGRAVESVHPRHLLHCQKGYGPIVKRTEDGRLILGVQGQKFDVTDKRCHLVGFGKAVLAMAVEVSRALGCLLKGGILSLPKGSLHQFPEDRDLLLHSCSSIKIYEGAENNQPDETALKAAKHIKRFVQSMTSEDILFVLITGGGSALLPLPRKPITLEEKRSLLKDLSNKGASIQELNSVRIVLSDIKGGRLASAGSQAHAIISLIISDIVGDPVHLIASGPTICPLHEEPSKRAQEIIHFYGLESCLSDGVRHLLRNTENCQKNTNSFIYVVGSNKIAVKAAQEEAQFKDYLPFILTTQLNGSVDYIEEIYFNLIKGIHRLRSRIISEEQFMDSVKLFDNVNFSSENCEKLIQLIYDSFSSKKHLLIIAAGEPTVEVLGNGLGGRNQELALRLSLKFHSDPELREIAYFLSAGTDGIDGPTPAAGAIGCSSVIDEFLKSNAQSEAPFSYVINNDSYHFYSNLTNSNVYHIISGHTGTNVMDIHLLLICS